MTKPPPLYDYINRTLLKNKFVLHQFFILLFTFLCYASYHMSRKPISIVKSVLHGKCKQSGNLPKNWCSWKPFDGADWSEKLGSLEYSYLLSYAMFMFFSGQIAERNNLRHYLSGGMILSGVMTIAFGAAFYLSIHSYWYFLLVQILTGIVQATGWPAVVSIMGNWFGTGKRGLIMGIWNSHTSFGNMIGSVIAGYLLTINWGLSFIVPGLLIIAMGIAVYALMIPNPEDIDFSNPDEVQKVLIELKESKSKDYLDKSGVMKPSRIIRRCNNSIEHNANKESAISIWNALKLPNVVPYAICLFFAKLVAYTFLYWLPNYLNRIGSGMSPSHAGYFSTIFDLGGIFGGIAAGYLSDTWIHYYNNQTMGRAGTCVLMFILAAPLMFIYQIIAASHSLLSFVVLFICGLAVNGPYALITTAVSADLGSSSNRSRSDMSYESQSTNSSTNNDRALATVTAIIDGTGSLGAALGPFLTGVIVPTGWNNVFLMLIVADLLALLSIFYIIYSNQQRILLLPLPILSMKSTNNSSASSVTSSASAITYKQSLIFISGGLSVITAIAYIAHQFL